MPTIKDVSRLTGLSYATISKYLNGGNVIPENRERIESAIKELDFTVNAFARGLKTNKSNAVAIIIPDIGNVLVANTIPVIVDELRKHGYAAIIFDSRSDHLRELELVRFSITKHVDGIINMPVGTDGAHLAAAFEKKIPIVLLDRIVTDCIGKVDAVMVDNLKASQDATGHLLAQGHSIIGVIAGPREITTSMERLSGYISAIKGKGISVRSDLIEHTDFTIESGYRACKRLIANNPDMTAIYATNYDTTVGAMMAINELGISVPGGLSVFGFDDMPFAQVIVPHLSVIAQPLGDIGKSAAKMLLDRMTGNGQDHPDIKVLKTRMILRDSVRSRQ